MYIVVRIVPRSNYYLPLPGKRFFSKNHRTSNLKNLLFDMPREKNHILEAQKQRNRIKEKSSKYIPGTVNLQVLGSGAPGSTGSVYLFTDQTR